jgi:nitrogen regulatory protein PII
MEIEVAGNGIALTIPLESIGGESCLKYLTEGQEIGKKKGEKMENLKYSLIIVVADRGASETVMDAARSANAKGGTVVSAKETEVNAKERFFGVSIAEEKEMIYILAKKQEKDEIMSAIMTKAGIGTDANAAVFSVPVDRIAGLRSLMTD